MFGTILLIAFTVVAGIFIVMGLARYFADDEDDGF